MPLSLSKKIKRKDAKAQRLIYKPLRLCVFALKNFVLSDCSNLKIIASRIGSAYELRRVHIFYALSCASRV
jgi:hypothetical protein